jgi:hypothetical protein
VRIDTVDAPCDRRFEMNQNPFDPAALSFVPSPHTGAPRPRQLRPGEWT